MSQTIEAPVEVRLPDEDNEHDHDRPWIVIVWNDPINLMSYVTFVLRKLFGFSEEEAQAFERTEPALELLVREVIGAGGLLDDLEGGQLALE